MCTGGQLLADFRAGTRERPQVPGLVGDCLTTTVDGEWVVWGHKIARPDGDRFQPMAGGEPYPAHADATCRFGFDHQSPEPGCTCGFHALSKAMFSFASPGTVCLEVALSGRVLAFAWPQGGVLLRAGRQTVMRMATGGDRARWLTEVVDADRRPDDPEGRLALRSAMNPRGAGPVALPLPTFRPPAVLVSEHVHYCPERISVLSAL